MSILDILSHHWGLIPLSLLVGSVLAIGVGTLWDTWPSRGLQHLIDQLSAGERAALSRYHLMYLHYLRHLPDDEILARFRDSRVLSLPAAEMKPLCQGAFDICCYRWCLVAFIPVFLGVLILIPFVPFLQVSFHTNPYAREVWYTSAVLPMLLCLAARCYLAWQRRRARQAEAQEALRSQLAQRRWQQLQQPGAN